MVAATWPQNYSVIPRAGRYSFPVDLIPSGGSVVRCTKTIDTSVARTGASTLRINPDASGTTITQKNLSTSVPMNLSSGLARLRFYWPYKSGTQAINVVLSNGTASANARAFNFNSNIIREGWNTLFLPVGNPDPTYKPLGYTPGVYGTGYDHKLLTNSIEINIEGSPTVDDVVYLDSIDTGSRARCKIVLGFDSADAGTLANALPVLDAYGWVAYNAMAEVYTDSASLVRLETFKASGWHTVNHSFAHGNYASLGVSESVADWAANDAFLLGAGLFNDQPSIVRRFFAYSENATTRDVSAALRDQCGVVSAREFRNPFQILDEYGVDNPQRVGSIEMGTAHTLAKNQGLVDYAVSQGATLFIFGHNIVAAPSLSTEWSTADFTALMATIRRYEQQGLLDVVSWYDWYTGLTHPAL